MSDHSGQQTVILTTIWCWQKLVFRMVKSRRMRRVGQGEDDKYTQVTGAKARRKEENQDVGG
jgi:hypothetical protein